MKLTSNAYFYIVILVIMAVCLVSAVLMEYFTAKLLPLLFSGTVFILAAVGLNNEIRSSGKRKATVTKDEGGGGAMAGERVVGYVVNVGWVGGFILGVYLVGFMIAIPLFVLAYMKRLGTRWPVAIIWAILTPAIMYLVFDFALDIDLHRGLLLPWLGWFGY